MKYKSFDDELPEIGKIIVKVDTNCYYSTRPILVIGNYYKDCNNEKKFNHLLHLFDFKNIENLFNKWSYFPEMFDIDKITPDIGQDIIIKYYSNGNTNYNYAQECMNENFIISDKIKGWIYTRMLVE